MTATNDPVNNPLHYCQGPLECIEAIEAMLTREQFVGFLRGQVIKYLWRADHKGNRLEDQKKAAWYLAKLNSLEEPGVKEKT